MRRVYDEEFKLNAIELSKKTGKNAFELEKELGIGRGCLSHWIKELEEKQKNNYSGKINYRDKEMVELKKKIKDLEMEREILKKAIAIFSGQKK